MKSKTAVAILLLFTAGAFAQEHMADTLRNGILEEDGKQNPSEAIKQYQTVLNQFEEARQTAATAVFRMAECYRKLGNRGMAVAMYQQVINAILRSTNSLSSKAATILATNFQTAANDPGDKAKYQQVFGRAPAGTVQNQRSPQRLPQDHP